VPGVQNKCATLWLDDVCAALKLKDGAKARETVAVGTSCQARVVAEWSWPMANRQNAIGSVELAWRAASPAEKAHRLKLEEAWLELAKLTVVEGFTGRDDHEATWREIEWMRALWSAPIVAGGEVRSSWALTETGRVKNMDPLRRTSPCDIDRTHSFYRRSLMHHVSSTWYRSQDTPRNLSMESRRLMRLNKSVVRAGNYDHWHLQVPIGHLPSVGSWDHES
jgi:hypothetical protein